MTTTRRDFLERLTGSAALLGAMPAALAAMAPSEPVPAPTAADAWDMSWVGRVKGKHKAVIDATHIEGGDPVYRAGMWKGGFMETEGAKPSDFSTVLVLRHEAIALAMTPEFWATYDVGKKRVPAGDPPTSKNPALLNSKRDGNPPMLDDLMLDRYLASGGIALACNVALGFLCVPLIAEKDKLSQEEAHKKAVSMLVPGVILQPSGVFATLRAQQAGCLYVLGS
ncbi:MAG: hypothetical protein HYR75_04350 [Gemmatimonadetes bacterium]|nr:hypothetical protein [Gemmatimonadota bacterium]MBI3568491.1 hypothetical protein [Gemmatimonadota bacterium]